MGDPNGENPLDETILTWEDVTKDLGTIAPGESVSFVTYFQVIGSGASATNRVEIVSALDEFGDNALVEAAADMVTLPIAGLTLSMDSTPPPGTEVEGGQRIEYTLLVTNTGGIDHSGLAVRGEIPANAAYVAGSAQPPVAIGGRAGGELLWAVDSLAQNGIFVARFSVEVLGDEFGGSVIATGQASSDQSPNPRTAQILHVALPTAIELLRFTAIPGEGGVTIEWVTGAEIDTWGFYLRRGKDNVFAHSQRLAGDLIPGVGANGGGAYQVVDSTTSHGG